MSNPHNKWLHKNIVNILIPAIQDMGFEWKKQGTAKEVGREIVLGLPFGDMRRRRGDVVDIVQISLRKRDRSFFIVRAGSCPPEGAREYLRGSHVPLDEMKVDYLEKAWALVPNPRSFRYFGFRFKWLRNLTEADYERLVRRVADYLPEIEGALVSGTAGPHMRFRYIEPQYK
jgi:hypothetical protein